MPNDSNERIYSIDDAAKHFPFRKTCILAAIQRGQLEAMTIYDGSGRYGWKYMIKESVLKRWANDPSMHVRGRKKPGPIIAEHYIRDDKPLVISGSTHVSDILKEGQTMTAEEMQNKLENAVYEETPVEDFSTGWLTVDDIAERIHCHKSSIKYHIKRGLLKATKRYCTISGPSDFMYMVKEEDFNEWVKGAGAKVGKCAKRNKNKETVMEKPKEVVNKESLVRASFTDLCRSDIDTVLELVKGVLGEACDKAYQDGYSAGYERGKEQTKKDFEGLESKLRGILDTWQN